MALVRSKGKSFQKASVIVLRRKFPNGYILKEDVTQLDKNGKWINIQTPEDLKKGKELNVSLAGNWIPALIEMQKDAEDYNEDDDADELFPKNLNSNNEVPNRLEIENE